MTAVVVVIEEVAEVPIVTIAGAENPYGATILFSPSPVFSMEIRRQTKRLSGAERERTGEPLKYVINFIVTA